MSARPPRGPFRRVQWDGGAMTHYVRWPSARSLEPARTLCNQVVGGHLQTWPFFDPTAPPVCKTCRALEVATP